MTGEAISADFGICRGDAPTLRFTMQEVGSIAGTTWVFTARETDAAVDPPALQVSGTVSDAGSSSTYGVVAVPLTQAQTLALSKRTYAFSLKRTDVAKTSTKGKMRVTYDIQNAAA